MPIDEKIPLDLQSPLVLSVHRRLMLTLIRALIASHSNPKALREAWARTVAMMYRDVLTEVAEDGMDPAPILAAFRELQDVWETYFPDYVPEDPKK